MIFLYNCYWLIKKIFSKENIGILSRSDQNETKSLKEKVWVTEGVIFYLSFQYCKGTDLAVLSLLFIYFFKLKMQSLQNKRAEGLNFRTWCHCALEMSPKFKIIFKKSDKVLLQVASWLLLFYTHQPKCNKGWRKFGHHTHNSF